MKRIAIVPSSYLPGKGYFDLLHDVDLALIDERGTYTAAGPMRALIHGRFGAEWLIVPRALHPPRRDPVAARSWVRAQWHRITTCYGNAPHFREYRDFFEAIYLERAWPDAASLNAALTSGIARDLLGITTAFERLDDDEQPARAPSVEALLQRWDGDMLVTAAGVLRDHLKVGEVRVVPKDLTGYPTYPQFGSSCDEVSILDVLFHTGPAAPWYIWGWRQLRRSAKVA